jgi:phage shock protein A
MSLMERVTALIRANLNDLIDRAEEPEKTLKQVILDMENQLIQVKTQVAIAIADEHLLVKKQQETSVRQADWMRKAERAVDKGDDTLARAAIERAEICRQTAEGLDGQLSDQRTQTESLRAAYRKLEHKLAEARTKIDYLIAKHRRTRAVRGGAQTAVVTEGPKLTLDSPEDTLEERFAVLERADRIEQLLSELKARRQV